MHGRLALNRDQVDECREKARHVAEHLQKNTERHTTLAVEQAVLRAIGAVPKSNHPIIHAIAKKVGIPTLQLGVAGWLGRVMVARKLSPEKAAEYLAKHGLGNRETLNEVPWSQAQAAVRDVLSPWQKSLPRFSGGKPRNGTFRTGLELESKSSPQEVKTKTDLLVVKVPHPPTPFDGMAMASRGLFRKTGYDLPHAMQRVGSSKDSPDVCFQGSGVPEAVICAARYPTVRLGVDPISQIRQTHVDPHKAFIDYGFMSRVSCRTGLRLHHDLSGWGDTEFLNTHAHQVISMQIVLEQWVMQSGGDLDRRVIVLPSLTQGKAPQDLIPLIACGQLYRELFPQSEIWVHASTHQPAWDVGMASLIGFTGVIVPSSSAPQLAQAKEWGQVLKPLAYECQFNDHGHISRLMHTLLERCMKELTRLYRTGLTRVIVQDHGGLFAMGKSEVGSDSVLEKDRRYWNPLDEVLK